MRLVFLLLLFSSVRFTAADVVQGDANALKKSAVENTDCNCGSSTKSDECADKCIRAAWSCHYIFFAVNDRGHDMDEFCEERCNQEYGPQAECSSRCRDSNVYKAGCPMSEAINRWRASCGALCKINKGNMCDIHTKYCNDDTLRPPTMCIRGKGEAPITTTTTTTTTGTTSTTTTTTTTTPTTTTTTTARPTTTPTTTSPTTTSPTTSPTTTVTTADDTMDTPAINPEAESSSSSPQAEGGSSGTPDGAPSDGTGSPMEEGATNEAPSGSEEKDISSGVLGAWHIAGIIIGVLVLAGIIATVVVVIKKLMKKDSGDGGDKKAKEQKKMAPPPTAIKIENPAHSKDPVLVPTAADNKPIDAEITAIDTNTGTTATQPDLDNTGGDSSTITDSGSDTQTEVKFTVSALKGIY